MGRKFTIWKREYKFRGRTFSIKKSVIPLTGSKHSIGAVAPRYAVSVSPKRTSWYHDFYSFDEAKKFAHLLLRCRK